MYKRHKALPYNVHQCTFYLFYWGNHNEYKSTAIMWLFTYNFIKANSKPQFVKYSIYLKSKLHLPKTLPITVAILSQSSFYTRVVSVENIFLRTKMHWACIRKKNIYVQIHLSFFRDTTEENKSLGFICFFKAPI